MDELELDYPTMSGPAEYRIRVRGRLNVKFESRLENMRIHNFLRDDGQEESVLEGRLADQSALAGVLNFLYELHMPVISADCLGVVDEDAQ